MRVSAQKQNRPQQQASPNIKRSSANPLATSHRAHPILCLQRTIGNQSVQRLLQSNPEEIEVGYPTATTSHIGHDFSLVPLHAQTRAGIQPKLTVNMPGDEYEQEADRAAEQVMRMPEPQLQRACPCGGGCPRCHTEQPGREHESLQTKPVQAGDSGQIAAPSIVHEALRSPGQPIDPATRAFMEPRFGYDFSRVRMHFDEAAEKSARDVNAHAYTVGDSIVFGAGRFAPESHEGRRLIAHELTHVVQQSTTSEVRVQRGPSDPGSPKGDPPILGGSGASGVVVLYHYGDLEARRELDLKTERGAPFKSPPGYPRLTDCDTAACQVEVTQHTGTPQNEKLRYKYEVRIDRNYFDKNFRNTGTRGAYSEYVTKESIPLTYLRRVDEIAPTTSAPPRLPPTSGEFIAKTLPDPTPPTGGAPPGRTTGGGGGAKPTTIRAETGAPVEPVVEATPGFTPGRGAGIGGGFQLAQAMQWGNLQGAEVAKYQERLAQLQPKIEKFLNSGYSVQLTLIVEKPNTVDLLCVAGAFCDASQFIYFRSLYISYVQSVKPIVDLSRVSTTHASISPVGGRDAYIPYTHQGGSIIDETEIPHLSPRDSLHHCEYDKLTLYPQESMSPINVGQPLPQPVRQPAPKPRLDLATKKALASAPSRVYILTENIIQYKTAEQVMKKIAGNASFGEVKEYMGGGLNQSRTVVSYRSDLDKPRAEALAEIVRSGGVSSVYVALSGDGDDAPGVLQIFFGRDAEK